ncbi:MAG: alpha/beta hydrolase [Endozoicomonadaceae bacterium]|nr:alpha/beta hydrolase [Endozoicomonadaceae bacterium]
MALHGWLENAASFIRLAPLLDGYRVIAIDLAGHGYSDHRSAGASYSVCDYVGDLVDIANALSLERFSILGHSMGAVVGVLTAGAFPDRIDQLMLIDSLWPILTAADHAPEQLAKAIKHRIRLRSREKTVFPDKSDAIAARLKGFGTISESARVLVERGLKSCDGGWIWRTDARLTLPSPLRMTDAQAKGFTDRLTMPTLLIVAESGLLAGTLQFEKKALEHLVIETLPGGHHLHLEEQAACVGRILMEFLSDDQE